MKGRSYDYILWLLENNKCEAASLVVKQDITQNNIYNLLVCF